LNLVVPVIWIDEAAIGSGKIGPRVPKLRAEMIRLMLASSHEIQIGENPS